MNSYVEYNYSNNRNNGNENSLYNPYNGFIRGNLFKNIYDPFNDKEPYEVRPMNEQAEMLTYINSLCFAMIDLNLYLDIYPDDSNAINLYNQYREEEKNLKSEYESTYGPLDLSSNSLMTTPWAWINMPWPWDN